MQRQQPKTLAKGVAQSGARQYGVSILGTPYLLLAQAECDGQIVLEVRLPRRAQAVGLTPPMFQGDDLEIAGRLLAMTRRLLTSA